MFLEPIELQKRERERERERERKRKRKMKRDRELGKMDTGKEKKWGEQQQQQQAQAADAGMDELFAVLGYKVKSSDMADVAEKLQQLEMAMCSTADDGETSSSFLLSNDTTVHYNPSDLSGWVQSMLSELNPISSSSSSTSKDIIIYDDDLRAIPGGAVFNNNSKDNNNKRMKLKLESESESPPPRPPAGNVVLVDSQETGGIRLVHTLMACAEALQQGNTKLADALVKHVGVLTVSQVGAMRKVATYFAEALARKIIRPVGQDQDQDQDSLPDDDVLQMHFYETGPYLKFAHFTANQAILEAFAGATRVHVVDFSLKQGMQWPALMQALALRPGGPPSFRLTGVGPPQPDNTDALQEVGWKLAQLAETVGIEFEFRGFVANSLADLDASMFDIRPSNVEAVAVNSVLELHRMLSRPGAIEKVLNLVKAMKPKIVTVVEQEANHNGGVFLERFNEALHYYSTMFDSLESCSGVDTRDMAMTEVHLGRQICNVVASQGAERVERHETLAQWRSRMRLAGFDAVHLGSNAFKQASMLLALFAGGGGYRVDESDGCLMLGWHTRPLIATSAWRINGGD